MSRLSILFCLVLIFVFSVNCDADKIKKNDYSHFKELLASGFENSFENEFQVTLSNNDGSRSSIFPLNRDVYNEVAKRLRENNYKNKKLIPEGPGPNGDRYFEFFPTHAASVYLNYETPMSNPCFQKSTVSLSQTSNNTVDLVIDAENKESTLCNDLLLIGTADHLFLHQVHKTGKQTLELNSFSTADMHYVQEYGLQIFLVQGGFLGFALDIFDTYLMFQEGDIGVKHELQFLQDYLNKTLEPRDNGFILIPEDQIRSGDYLAIFKLGGPHGGENCMEAYGTGGLADHVAMTLWIDDVLFVCESMGGSNDERNGIIKTEYKKWMTDQNSDGNMVSVLRLNDDSLAKFNHTAAIEFWKQSEGLPYGFHNYLFGFIDTLEENYVPPLSKEFIPVFFSLVDRINPAVSTRMWGEALNMRLGTNGLNMEQILNECYERNISFYELMTVPEQDDWVYSDGKSMVCDVFVMAVYKHAGVFGDLDFQATELTPLNSYALNIFNSSSSWMPQACAKDGLGYCQVMGDYYLDLYPHFNTIAPYGHMFNNCPSYPPNYDQIPGC